MDFSELIAAADPSIFTESIKAWVSGLNINSVIMLIMMIFMIVGAIDRIPVSYTHLPPSSPP